MALNPSLDTQNGRQPCLEEYELLLHVSAQTEFVIESGGGYPGAGGSYYSRCGRIFLTGTRLVFVSDDHHSDGFEAFELPLLSLRSAKLVKRFVMKRRVISGSVEPTPNGGLVGVGSFRLTFHDGTAKEFFQTLREAMLFVLQFGVSSQQLEARREERPTEEKVPVLQAFIDPNDPFSIFVTDPTQTSPVMTG
eukprot:CAMPEP_0118941444 /NCGR_PEP_ID=MMETSP1169-20130426/33901_1 /TAXON_ID=36882 /ORGANISM="Pyramimonas obovata, Strain CCMP722" /LENGTH=192 /DNA_ID=CAMNT_0006886195 /DNA_START=86 /DNA_END=664 /DNA_ORIENTATION=-